MNNITRMKTAINVLSEIDDFNDAYLIAYLGWKSIPEAYKLQKSYVTTNRISIYQLNSTVVVDIGGVGLFQIN